jgi:hypothetical protein
MSGDRYKIADQSMNIFCIENANLIRPRCKRGRGFKMITSPFHKAEFSLLAACEA